MGNRVKKKVTAYLEPDLWADFNWYCESKQLSKSDVLSSLVEMLIEHGYDRLQKSVKLGELIYAKTKRIEIQIDIEEGDNITTIANKIRAKTLEKYSITITKTEAKKKAKQFLASQEIVTVTQDYLQK